MMFKKSIYKSTSIKISNEYKEVVDIGSIVSKTDAKGIITFVNEKFCEVSGYSAEELIGQSHNIVRHPDMPDMLFKDMWQTIEKKQPWIGKVKNRKKNGDAYYVNTVINPIVNNDENIVAYIGVRTDVTDIEMIKEQLTKDLDISNENFTEAYKTSLLYQSAIEQSNILIRVDINGKITYVNQQFCEISGYTKDELIGKTHDIIRDSDNAEKIYKDLCKTISSGKTWKGQLENRAKDGGVYYVNSTIVPILNKHDDIFEYLSINHDVTNIVNFHKELEDTQKEILCKMGEIAESRSKETAFHVKRVADYSKELAILSGLSQEDADLLYAASPMHDIGKVGLSDSILQKTGSLDDEEWLIMKMHPEIGYNILKESRRPILKAAAIVSYTHHEKWDGSGYPNALEGEDIHIFGRITAIADVFDALLSERTYKKAWEIERVIEHLTKEKSKHFDPVLMDIFLKNIDKMLFIREKKG